MPVIEVRNIHFDYDGVPVLKGLSCAVAGGEILGVAGPNGSGKTTLLKVIDGICVPAQGRVLLDGEDMTMIGRQEIARTIAVVPQDSSMVFSFTVEEVIMMGRAPHLGRLQFEGKTDFAIVRNAMEKTEVVEFAARNINELSGGERQRVFIARALAQQPRVMLLDESTAFLDIKHQLAFFDLIRTLNRTEGLTVIVVTHDINLASLYCDRVMLMKAGRIHAIGTPSEVLTKNNIEEVYETDVLVDSHPIAGLPRVTIISGCLSD